jgi:hypothetical protein
MRKESKTIEAMKQALEALEDYEPKSAHKAITALRAAIAEAAMQRLTNVQQEMDCYGDGNVYRGQRSGDSQYQTIYEGSFPEKIWEVVPPRRETEQPQVVYRLAETDIYDFAGWLTLRPGVMRVGLCCEAGPMADAVRDYLRTFPERFAPRREWVGLTDEDISAAALRAGCAPERDCGALVAALARAIEAKLKEKNS